MSKLLKQARERGTGCGSFSVYSMEAMIGTLRAAEELEIPVIIQLAEARFKTAPLELVGPMMINAAEKAKVEVAVHLDHGSSPEVIRRALEMGFTSVMYDGSAKPFEENVRNTKIIKEAAKPYGADVEAELGLVGRGAARTVCVITESGVPYRQTRKHLWRRQEWRRWPSPSETSTAITRRRRSCGLISSGTSIR